MSSNNEYPKSFKFGELEELVIMEQEKMGSMMQYASEKGGDIMALAQAILDNQVLYVKCADNDWCLSHLQYYSLGTLHGEAVLVFTSWKADIEFVY